MPMDTQLLNLGEQIPVDPTLGEATSPEMQDYGEWNETLPKELQDALIRLATKFSDEFKYPRRLEVMQAWKARSFWRELQHLSWNWDKDCWDVLGPAGTDKTNVSGADSAVLYTTNIYQGFGESFIAIVTQAIPNLRFEPQDPEEPADVETAAAGDNIRKMIQHENDPIKLMTKAAFYAWTDGRIHGRTSWEKDSRTGQFRETQRVYGSMEVKVPIIYDEQSEYNYLQFSEESHLSKIRSLVRERGFDDDYWKKIKGGNSKSGQDTWERIARISVKQGVSIKSAGGDAYAYLGTIQRTWMRPSCFMEESESVTDEIRTQLETIFPTGCQLETASGVYIGSKDATMDDEWAVKNIMEGDGSFRNAKGTCLISVQERANDIANCAQDTYEKCQPASHWDDQLFDVAAMEDQQSTPGKRYPINKDALAGEGDAIANHVFFEPAAQVSADMLTFLQSLMTDVPEFLTGISAILWGQSEGGDQSGKALSIQQAAAMGRMGLPYRIMKQFYAQMMEQAIRCASCNRKEDSRMGIPDENGEIQPISVRIEDLRGEIRCFPDVDESYPESWMSKRSTWMNLMADGNSDPEMRAIITNPRNQAFGKKMIGLQELVLPDADSWNKQMVEINFMLNEPPTEQPQPMPNPLTGDAEVISVPQSSVPIDVDFDNHEAEFVTVCNWINSPKGQRAKREKQAGYENIRLHGLAHRAEIIKKMAAAMMENKTDTPAGGKPKDKGQASPPKDQPEGGQGAPPLGGPAPA